jgi:beta-glucosidase
VKRFIRGVVVAPVVCAGVLGVSMTVSTSGAAAACGTHPWCHAHLSAHERAAMVVAAMNPADKLALVANGSAGDPAMGIPALRGIDGPNGVGEGNTHVTAFPDAETLSAAWDASLARAYGRALGAEAGGKGYDWLFAPTVNIVRTPKWGREAETFGEDPYLSGAIAAPEIQGIQSQHVISEVKHYVGNDQEVDRFGQPLGSDAVSDQVSERALQEIYEPSFKSAVQQGHAGSVMCSYNRINTIYSCQDPQTLATLKAFGLKGFVGPDALLAVRDDVVSANAGVDNFQLGSIATATGANELTILTNAYTIRAISQARLNDMTMRILDAMFAVGVVNHPPRGGQGSVVSTPAHRELATRVAEDATVLLKNRGGVLPLSRTGGSVAVIGHDAGAGTQIEENGSPAVLRRRVVTPLAGVRRLAGRRSRISYASGTRGVVALSTIPTRVLTPTRGSGHGLTASFYSGQTGGGAPVLTRTEPTVDFSGPTAPLSPIPDANGASSAVWTGTLTPPAIGVYRFSLKVAGVAELAIAGHVIASGNAEFPTATGGSVGEDPGASTITFQGLAHLVQGHPVTIRVQYATGSSLLGASLQVGWEPPDPSRLARAVGVARHAHTAVVFVNDVTSEGMDRTSLQLPGDQDRLIEAVAAVNPRTIVVLHTAGPVLMPWLSRVAGIIEAWYPGQQSGAAIAATLFGSSDPSGHLPVTFPRTGSQGPATTTAEYPGIDNLSQHSEGIFVGYRYYQQHHQTPLFPFGYGLSYTTFALSHLTVTPASGGGARAVVTLRNTGRRAGAEVVQAYLSFPASAGEPPRQLKAFAKVSLAPGASRAVTLTLPRSSFQYFSVSKNAWTTPPGRFRIEVGISSSDLPLSASVRPR